MKLCWEATGGAPGSCVRGPLTYAIKLYLFRDGRNRIHFWYYPSKAEWSRHKLIDNQVKVGTNVLEFPCKNSYLFNRKKEYNNILQEWQSTFANSLKRGYYFLMFKNKDQQVIKLIYVKGSSWLSVIGFTNFLYACFTCMTTGHAPIGEYVRGSLGGAQNTLDYSRGGILS